MLHPAQRLRDSADFSAVTRSGRRSRRGELVTYLLPGDSGHPARAGLVVGKSVGNSVVRHRVSRRLREQLRGEMRSLAEGDRLVVRALPGAADRSSSALGEDLRASLRRLASPDREQL